MASSLILLLAPLLLAACQARDEQLPPVHAPRVEQAPSTSSAEPVDVSLLQLIATPSEYGGKVVRVIGFCHLEFEGNGLYLHREDFERAISKNAIWLDVDRDKQALSDQYVLVEGTFDGRGRGHLGMFAGSLTDVSRIERWRSRKEYSELPSR